MNLKNHFLVAMPHLEDELFERSVVYIFEHTNEGALGLILNKPIANSSIQLLFKQFDFSPYRLNQLMQRSMYRGGPSQENQGYILHSYSDFDETSVELNHDLMITRSQELLKTIGTPEEPAYFQVFLGHSGWEAFQLEYEIQSNDWLVVPADLKFLKEQYFQHTTPDEFWLKTAQLIQVDLKRVSTQYGRA